jgi:hypothetical protein
MRRRRAVIHVLLLVPDSLSTYRDRSLASAGANVCRSRKKRSSARARLRRITRIRRRVIADWLTSHSATSSSCQFSARSPSPFLSTCKPWFAPTESAPTRATFSARDSGLTVPPICPRTCTTTRYVLIVASLALEAQAAPLACASFHDADDTAETIFQ